MVVMFFSVGTFAQLDQFSLPFEHERIHFPSTTICGIQTNWGRQMLLVNDQKPVNRDFDKLSPLYQELYLIEYEKQQGLIDLTTEALLLPLEYEDISYSRIDKKPTRFVVKKDGKYGLVNIENESLLPIEYERLWISEAINVAFSKDSLGWQIWDLEGHLLAHEYFEDIKQSNYLPITVKKQGKWGGINRHGDIIFPFQYDKASGFQMSPKHRFGQWPSYYPASNPPEYAVLLASFSIGDTTTYFRPNKANYVFTPPFIEREGKQLTFSEEEWNKMVPTYLNGNYTNPSYKMELHTHSRDGFNILTRYDIIDADGSAPVNATQQKVVKGKIPGQYYINGKIYYLTGEAAQEEKMDSTYYKKIQIFTYEPSGVRWAYNGQFFALLDAQGAKVVPFIYEKMGYQREGLIAVQKDGQVGFMNANGETVIPLQYDDDGSRYFIYEFVNGRSIAFKNGHYGFIDKQGATIIDFTYDAVAYFGDDFAIAYREGSWEKIVFP